MGNLPLWILSQWVELKKISLIHDSNHLDKRCELDQLILRHDQTLKNDSVINQALLFLSLIRLLKEKFTQKWQFC